MGVFLRAAVKVVAMSAMVVGTYGAVAAPAAAAAAVATPAPAAVTVAVAAGVGAAAAEGTPSVPVELSSLVAEHARDSPRVRAKAVAGGRKGGKAAAAPKSSCDTLKAFLLEYYFSAWRLAMHTPNGAAAFEVFALARRYARSYVAARPGAKPAVVCVTKGFQNQVLKRVLVIMKRHQKAGGPLPPLGKYRSMTRAEAAVMRKAAAVPLDKPLPKWAVPKSVPMFV